MSVHYFSECLRENMAEAKKHHKLPFAFKSVFGCVRVGIYYKTKKNMLDFPKLFELFEFETIQITCIEFFF